MAGVASHPNSNAPRYWPAGENYVRWPCGELERVWVPWRVLRSGNGRSVAGKAVVHTASGAGAFGTSDANVATVASPFGSMRTSHELTGSSVQGETALSWMAS